MYIGTTDRGSFHILEYIYFLVGVSRLLIKVGFIQFWCSKYSYQSILAFSREEVCQIKTV